MKGLSVMVLLRSGARQVECRGCGRPVLVFDGDPAQLTHEPPECAWFRTLMEKHQQDVSTELREVKDDVSN